MVSSAMEKNTSGAAGRAAASEALAYLEIAVYEVKEAAHFAAIRAETMKLMAKLEGFLWWIPLRGDDNAFADVVAWSSPETAKAAAEAVTLDKAFAPFVTGIDVVRHLSHYRGFVSPAMVQGWLTTAPLVEIALYTVVDAAKQQSVHQRVYAQLAQMEGMLGGTRLEAVDGENGFGDLLLWRDRAAFESTGKALMANPELAPFFENVQETHVFALFSREGEA